MINQDKDNFVMPLVFGMKSYSLVCADQPDPDHNVL